MAWLEQKIRRYEHMRWAQEPNRRTLPFAWGLEHIGGDAKEAAPPGFLDRFVDHTLAHSEEWYAVTPADDYLLADDVLTFTSAIESPWPGNNRVHAQLFRARHTGPAVVVLAQWNARWEEQQNVCRWLNRLGITAVKMSLPYHDRRAVPEHPCGAPSRRPFGGAECWAHVASEPAGGDGCSPNFAVVAKPGLRPVGRIGH